MVFLHLPIIGYLVDRTPQALVTLAVAIFFNAIWCELSSSSSGQCPNHHGSALTWLV
jgi:hypothetical protein